MNTTPGKTMEGASWQTWVAEAATLRALALLFTRPRPETQEERSALEVEVQGDGDRAALAAARNVDEGLYLAIFGPGGLVSPREAGWRGRSDPGEVLADLAAFHEAFAYQNRSEEPADHLSVEVDFVAYLRLKQAFALANGEEQQASVTAEACERFLDQHVRRYLGRLAARLEELGIAAYAPAAHRLAERLGPCSTEDEGLSAPSEDWTCPFESAGCSVEAFGESDPPL